MTSLSRRPGIANPIWWVALAILIVNDHVLKRSAVAGIVTGKLSDFAGLIVAPVLAASLLRARGRGARLACFAAVVLPFIAIKVSAQAAAWVMGLTASCGVPWRVWVDPTDLVALAVLPVAWRISAGHALERIANCRGVVLHKLGAMIGAVACVATSVESQTVETSAYLVNTTHEPLEVRVFRLKDPPDCAALSADPSGTLRALPFELDRCQAADPLDIVPLDQDWRDVSPEPQIPQDAAPPWRVCDAVVIRVAGLPDTAVYWNQIPKLRLDLQGGFNIELGQSDADPHALYLEQFADALVVQPTTLLATTAVDWPLPAPTSGCTSRP